MPCENIKWGYWINGTCRGKKYRTINPNPLKKRAKIIIGGEWYTDEQGNKHCREWTEEEINSGYGHTKYGKVKLVPIKCQKCDQCRLAHANEWVTRILCEYKTAGKQGCKIDLTYNPENVPAGYVLKKSDYQGFVKRLRTYLKRNDPEYKGFKYYIGGEYGPKGGRPHYHIIIIGWKPKDLEYWKDSHTGYPMYTSETIDKNWTTGKGKNKSNNGYATIEDLTPETVSYATRYTHKKSGEEKENKGISEFQAQSQNIGLEYWNQNKEEIIKDGGIWIKKGEKARLVKIPRYFCKKWADERPVQYEIFMDWNMEHIEKQQKGEMEQTDKTLINYIKDKIESAKYAYNLLKRENLDTQENLREQTEQYTKTLKKTIDRHIKIII